MSIIELDNIGKRFKDSWALKNVTLTFDAGKIYGLVGRNGSGKTVMMKIIAGMIVPTEGTVIVEGKHIGTDMEMPDSVGAIIEVPGYHLQNDQRGWA